MRALDAARIELSGDLDAAAALIPFARTLLGKVRELGMPVRHYTSPAGARFVVRDDITPPLIQITVPQPNPQGSREQTTLRYQFLSTGPTLSRAGDGCPLGYAVRVALRETRTGVRASASPSSASAEVGDAWPTPAASGIFATQPLRLTDRTFATPDAFWPDARKERGKRGYRVLYGPRMDGYAPICMQAKNSATRARINRAAQPYAERDGAALIWYGGQKAAAQTIEFPGVDVVHGFALQHATHPTYGERDVFLAVDSHGVLWARAIGGEPQSMAIPLPGWVFTGNQADDLSQRPGWKWRFSSDGKKCCAVVFERKAAVVDSFGVTFAGGCTFGYAADSLTNGTAPVQLDAGGLVEFAIEVKLSGRGANDISLSVTLTRDRRTEDLGVGILAADYAWTDDALVTAAVDLYITDTYDPNNNREFSILSIARDGESPVLQVRVFDNLQRFSGGRATDWTFTGIAGMDLRALSACFVVKRWRQDIDPANFSHARHWLDASVLAYVGGELVERVDAGTAAFDAFTDLSVPSGWHRIMLGESMSMNRAARTTLTAGSGPQTMVDGGLWRLGPIASAYNDNDPVRCMLVHPDGHYAVCTAQTLTYQGAAYVTGSNSFNESPISYSQTAFGSLSLDVIAVQAAEQRYRLRHLDLLNGAFGKEWTYSEFGPSVTPYGSTGFTVQNGAGTATFSGFYLFGLGEFDDTTRLAASTSSVVVTYGRGMLTDSEILAAQSAFTWRTVTTETSG